MIIFVLVGSLIVMNMLVGILVEAVQTVATMEHEQIHVDFAKRVLWELIKEEGADQDGDNRISEDEFVRPEHASATATAKNMKEEARTSARDHLGLK